MTASWQSPISWHISGWASPWTVIWRSCQRQGRPDEYKTVHATWFCRLAQFREPWGEAAQSPGGGCRRRLARMLMAASSLALLLPAGVEGARLKAQSTGGSVAGGLTGVTVEVVGQSKGVEQVVLAQKAANGTLPLLPDYCFFSGEIEGLKLSGSGTASDPMELNKGRSFTSIEGLNNRGQRVVWPLWLHAGGTIEATLYAQGNGTLGVMLGDEKAAFTSARGGAKVLFKKAQKGRVDLVISPVSFRGSVQKIVLGGSGINGAQLLRARWRPSAVHSGFGSSTLGSRQSRLWIMEVRPVWGEQGFYGPITTPFGYFGSTFRADHTSGGVNFSMWSFAAGKQEPPLPQLSHLLAVGSPQASFGGFSHEGTGVKLRDWNPYEGQKLESVVLALRIEPGRPYDTYSGYFWDPDGHGWRFYAAGRKWSEKRSVESLLPGCFVEVPGPPDRQRTGQILRAADFRGWCRDANGGWHWLDEMLGSKQDAQRDPTNCLWTTVDDGWFRMGMGGMIHYRYPKGVNLRLPPAKTQPDYLASEQLKALERCPTEITVGKVTCQGGRVNVEIVLRSQ